MQQNENANILNEVYKTAKMGAGSIKKLIGHVDNSEIKDCMLSQLDSYKRVMSDAENELLANNITPKGEGLFTKAMAAVSIKTKAAKDTLTPSEISEMLIQGSTMGIIDLKKSLNENMKADQQVKNRAQKLIQFEQKSINAFKRFL